MNLFHLLEGQFQVCFIFELFPEEFYHVQIADTHRLSEFRKAFGIFYPKAISVIFQIIVYDINNVENNQRHFNRILVDLSDAAKFSLMSLIVDYEFLFKLLPSQSL